MTALRSIAARWLPALACALLAAWAPAHAEIGPKARPALSQQTEQARVIVRFKTPLAVDATRTVQRAGRSGAAPSAVASAEQVAQALQARADGLSRRHGLALRAGRAIDDRMQVVMASGLSSAALVAQLQADPDVDMAVIDYRRRVAAVPNDPLFNTAAAALTPPLVSAHAGYGGQWYLKPPEAQRLVNGDEVLSAIDAQHAWDTSKGSASVVVAVVDTGVRYDHPDLQGKLLAGFDFIHDSAISNDGNGRDSDASDPGDWITSGEAGTGTFKDCTASDSSWHGTQVAGLIGANTNNGVGIAGTGWNVKVLPVRVLGKCFGYDSDIIAGMRWAAGLHIDSATPDNPNPAQVINMSLGDDGTTITACSSTAYPSAISEVTTQGGPNGTGSVVVVAGGNGTGHGVQPPGNCAGVLAVGGVRHIGTKVGYSNIGPEIAIAAPAGNCVNTGNSDPCIYPMVSTSNSGTTTPAGATYTDTFNYAVGTSFSAPLVAGTAALMYSADPSLTPDRVRTILQNTARAFPFRGAPAGSSGVVAQCHAADTTDQIECYCTASTCGAGMLDAAWAVYTAANAAPLPAVTVVGGSAAPGQAVTLSASGTSVASGRSISTYSWEMIDDGGIVSGFTGGSGATMSVTPSTTGKFSVRLTVTDDQGVQGVHEQTIDVVQPSPAPSSGGGGGALSAGWAAGLAMCVLVLATARRRA